jgi:NAD-dependent dihydropyrimidine dehydrogenase PreA subunit
MKGTVQKPRVIVYEGAGSRSLASEVRTRLLSTLLDRGYSVGRVLPQRGLADLKHEEVIVLGAFEQEMAADGDGAATIVFRDIGRLAAAAAFWKPWFPVIDFDRCTNCMQCLSFCLFDVYGATSDGKIQVQNEDNCKTDCPACSRVCPEVAILFPKYKSGPINGDVVSQDDVRREAMKVDISALLGGDIYAMLRDRSAKAKSRFSKERDEDRALRERQRCLQKLKEAAEVEVPAEVLASLPSLDQIQEKALAAKRRAQEALDRQRDSAAG